VNDFEPRDAFDYHTAFQRNLGFLNEEEQERLRRSRIAIAGLGGTGGAQAHALARLGLGAFHLADPDTFELANFNRQLGATLSTLGKPKTATIRDIIHDINPEADIRLFTGGINADNIGEFLTEVDVVVDSLDFYCFKERFLLYGEARRRGLWVVTSPPLGFGFTLLNFDPHGMSFEDYFGFNSNMEERELVVSLVAGIVPRPYMMRYLRLDPSRFKERRLPSVGAAPFMSAGVVATEVVNLIIRRVPPLAVPTVLQFDALLHRFHYRRYRLGMRGPLQRLKKRILRQRLTG